MGAHIIDVLINLVGEDDDVGVFLKHFGKGLELCLTVNGSCGVGGRAEDESACLGSDGSLELGRCYLEVLVDACGYNHGCAVCEFDHLGVAHPIGGGYYHLVTFAYDSHDDVAHALLGTVGAQYLGRSVVKAVLSFQFVYDGLAQHGITGHW